VSSRLELTASPMSKQYAVSRGSVAGDIFLHSDRARHEALPRVGRYPSKWITSKCERSGENKEVAFRADAAFAKPEVAHRLVAHARDLRGPAGTGLSAPFASRPTDSWRSVGSDLSCEGRRSQFRVMMDPFKGRLPPSRPQHPGENL